MRQMDTSKLSRKQQPKGDKSRSLTHKIRNVKDECQVLKHAIFVKEVMQLEQV